MINTEEIWVNCKIESDIEYEISNLGNIREKETKNIKTQYNDKGMKSICVYYGGIKIKYMVHRIVCSSFDDRYDNGLIKHKNNDKSDNTLNNLKYKKKIEIKNEIWKECPIAADYFISNFGRVKNKNDRPIRQQMTEDGYKQVRIRVNNKYNITRKVHRLVLLTFKPELNFENAQINHIDGNKINNKVDNLEWCTQSENIQHAYDTRLMVQTQGSARANSKLNEKIVKIIKLSYKNKYLNQTELADIFEIKQGSVSSIIHNKSWKHVTI